MVARVAHESALSLQVIQMAQNQSKGYSTSVGWRTTVERLPRNRHRRRNLPLDGRLSAI